MNYLNYEYSPTMNVPGASQKVMRALHASQRNGVPYDLGRYEGDVAEMIRRQQQAEVSGDMTYISLGQANGEEKAGLSPTVMIAIGAAVLAGVYLLTR